MTTPVAGKTEASVKWLDVNRKVLIDCIAEHSDGRYSNMKNSKTAWKSVVVDFKTKTGLPYDKKILTTQVQTLKRNWSTYDQFANNSGFGVDANGFVTAAPEALNTYFATHPNAAHFANTPLPFYSELTKLFSRK